MKIPALRGHLGTTLLTIGAFLALPVLAWYEFQWIGETEKSERSRRELQLNDQLSSFTADFNGELQSATVRLHIAYQPPPMDGAPLPLLSYQTTGTQIIEAVYYAELNSRKESSLYLLKTELERPKWTPWPAAWQEIRPRLLSESNRFSEDRSTAWHFIPELPALVQEVGDAPVPLKDQPPPLPRGLLIVAINSAYLERQVFPELTRSHFGPDGFRDYQVQVRSGNLVLYNSEPRQLFTRAERRITLGGNDPRKGKNASEDSVSSSGGWQLAVAPSSLATSPIGRFRAGSTMVTGASFLVLGAALVALLLSMRRAARLARVQWEFVSGMSHELRTPVAALRSIAENMRDGVVGPGGTIRYGKLVALQAERLSSMLEDVLEFGRPEEHGQKVDQVADVHEAVDQAILAYSFSLDEQHFEIEKDVPADLCLARCSGVTLRQSIQNLLGNSIKYGAKERWIRIAARSAGEGEITISVEDRGGGIRRDELKAVFEPFFRGQDARASQIPGVGLGLSVVKRNMDAVGGRILVKSQPGHGACFTLLIPSADTDETPNSHC